MLTLHNALLMAKMAYRDNYRDTAFLDPVESSGWQLQYRSKTETFPTGLENDTQLSYSGLCFTKKSTNNRLIVLIAHQGTVKDQCHNLVSDSQLISQQIPTETQVAAKFSDYCQKKIKETRGEDARLLVIHVGHSLGGAHARIVACQEGDSFSFTIDNPGVLSILEKIGLAPQGDNRFNHFTLLSEENIINEHGARCGAEIYQLMAESATRESSTLNLGAHKLKYLIDRIPPDYKSLPFFPGFVPPDGFKRCHPRDEECSRRSDATTPPHTENISLEAYRRGSDTGYRMKSKLAFQEGNIPEWVTDKRCLIHFVSVGEGVGHSMIIIEQIKIHPETNEHYPHIGYYDLLVDKKESGLAASTQRNHKVHIRVEEYSYHARPHRYDRRKTASFEKYGDQLVLVEDMIASIKDDAKNPENLTYEFTAGGILFPKGPNIVNCCKWCLQKLKIAGILPKFTGVIADVPAKSEIHGVVSESKPVDQEPQPSENGNREPRASDIRSPVRADPKDHSSSRSGFGKCVIL